jgi:hypothetical protein
MGLAIAAGALTVMFINLDKFQSFSAAGVQAELKKTVEQAYATIEQIKEIITPFIWSSITNLTLKKNFLFYIFYFLPLQYKIAIYLHKKC